MVAECHLSLQNLCQLLVQGQPQVVVVHLDQALVLHHLILLVEVLLRYREDNQHPHLIAQVLQLQVEVDLAHLLQPVELLLL